MSQALIWGIASAVVVFLEFIFIFVEEFAYSDQVKRGVRIVSQCLMGLCTICFLVTLALCFWICVDLFLNGNDVVSAIKMLITTAIVLIGIYILLLRRFLKSIRKSRNIK